MSTPPPLPKKTRVLGYFNNNNFPVQVDCTAINRAIILRRKGDYIRDEAGNKINDPIFERYLGPKALSKEETTDGKLVPIRYVQKTTDAAPTPGAQPTPTPVAQNTSPVGQYSMAEARRLGLVGPKPALPENFGVKAAKPGESTDPLPDIDTIMVPLDKPIPQKIKSMPPVKLTDSLPPPNFDEEPLVAEEQAQPVQESVVEKPFICTMDLKAFQFRSQLANHVKKHFPNDYDVLMAQYPETPRGRKKTA